MSEPHPYRPSGESGRSGRSGRDPGSKRADRAQLEAQPVSLRRIARLFAPYRGRLLLVVALIVVSSVIGLAQPFLVKHVIDTALPERDTTLLVLSVAAMVLVAIASAALGVAQTLISTEVGQRVMHRLRTDLFGHLQRQSRVRHPAPSWTPDRTALTSGRPKPLTRASYRCSSLPCASGSRVRCSSWA